VSAGLIQPTLLADGQVRVDMGPPTLAAAAVPTTLEPTRPDGSVVAQVTRTGLLPAFTSQLDAAGTPRSGETPPCHASHGSVPRFLQHHGVGSYWQARFAGCQKALEHELELRFCSTCRVPLIDVLSTVFSIVIRVATSCRLIDFSAWHLIVIAHLDPKPTLIVTPNLTLLSDPEPVSIGAVAAGPGGGWQAVAGHVRQHGQPARRRLHQLRRPHKGQLTQQLADRGIRILSTRRRVSPPAAWT
jgi:hypothetical protein